MRLSLSAAFVGLALLSLATYPAARARAADADAKPATLVIHVPADATLEVEGKKTRTKGEVRELDSPPLPAGRAFTYTLKATWTEKGEEKSRELKAKVEAGKKVDVDFTKAPEPAARADPKPEPRHEPLPKPEPQPEAPVKVEVAKPTVKDEPRAEEKKEEAKAADAKPGPKPEPPKPEPRPEPPARPEPPVEVQAAKQAAKDEPKAEEKKEEPKAEDKKEEAKAGDADAKPDPYAAVKPADTVNPLNTVWTLLAAFLVFGMQVGFTMLEAGFCRSRETVNVLMECIVDTCLCGVLFFAFGFAFMFGHGNGFIGWGDGNGHTWFFLQNVPATYEATGVAFLAFWLFQFAFADTCSTITSGAMIGRTGFVGDLLYSVCVSGFIYPIIGHWAWGPDGFLATMGSEGNFLPSLGTGFHDFAGSTVVHTIGGFVALAGAIVLGPRLGRRFKRDGGGPMLPHDLTIAACGGLLLWFGWYGFNPGSTLSAMDFEGIGRVATNTTLAACAAGLTAMFAAYIPGRKWDVSFTVNGFLAGLVAITCPCYWVDPVGSVLLGGVAGVIVVLGVELLEWLRIDDPIGAVPVHGICGIWGTLSLGLFACGKYGATGPVAPDNSTPLTGLFYGGGLQVLQAQAIGSVTITCATFAVSLLVMHAVNLLGLLRVSKGGELQGLDLHEHGISAYPEYVISSPVSAGGAEPRPATIPADGNGRFSVVVEGVDEPLLVRTWSNLCQPAGEGPSPDFLEVYPYVTTMKGNRFQFRGGKPEIMRDRLQAVLQARIKGQIVRARLG